MKRQGLPRKLVTHLRQVGLTNVEIAAVKRDLLRPAPALASATLATAIADPVDLARDKAFARFLAGYAHRLHKNPRSTQL